MYEHVQLVRVRRLGRGNLSWVVCNQGNHVMVRLYAGIQTHSRSLIIGNHGIVLSDLEVVP